MTEDSMLRLSENCSISLGRLLEEIKMHYYHYQGIEHIDLSMFPEDTQKTIFNALAEEHLRKDLYNDLRRDVGKAIVFFHKAHNLERLIELGDELVAKCDNRHQLETAENAFVASGRTISPSQYNSLGQRWLRLDHGEYDAIAAFAKAGNRKALVELATIHIKEGDTSIAKHALEAIDRKLTRHQYRLAGDVCLRKGELLGALHDYENARYIRGIIEVGNRFLKEGDLEYAKEAYKKCRRKLRPTPEQYSKAGDLYFKRSHIGEAIKAYKKARNTRALLRVGRYCLNKGSFVYLDNACEAYRAAGQRMPQERLLQIANNGFRVGAFEDAFVAYSIIGDRIMSTFTKQLSCYRDKKEVE